MENLIKLNNFYKKAEEGNLSGLSINKVSLFTEPNALFLKKEKRKKWINLMTSKFKMYPL